MLTSVGKSAPIGERLTRRKARSAVPGELQLKEVLSTESCLQRCGTVQVISCCAQLADWPPAIAADCSAVGCGGCASSPALKPDGTVRPVEFVVFEFDTVGFDVVKNYAA